MVGLTSPRRVVILAGWLGVLIGTGLSEDGQQPAATSEAEFVPPSYANKNLADVEQVLLDDLDRSAEAVRKLQEEIAALPEDERYRFPSGDDVHLSRDQHREHLAFFMNEVTHYREHTNDPPEARPAGEKLLATYFGWKSQLPDAPQLPDVLTAADAAEAAGCYDRTIRVYTVMARHQLEPVVAFAKLDEIIGGSDSSSLAPLAQTVVDTYRFKLALYLRKDRAVIDELFYAAVDKCIKTWQLYKDLPNQRMLLFLDRDLVHDLSLDRMEDVLIAALEAQDVPLWHLHRLAGKYYEKLAWRHRGGGFANTVSREGWENFGKYSARAARHYLRAWQMHRDYPQVAAHLIEVANSSQESGWGPKDWFYETIRAEFDYSEAYLNYAWALTPRWGGSIEEMLGLAEDCLASGRWDTSVPAEAFRILTMVRNEPEADRPFGAYPGVADVMGKYLSGLRAAKADVKKSDPPIRGDQVEVYAMAAVIFSQSGRYDDVQAVFEEAPDDLAQKHVNWGREKLSLLKGRAAAATGPAASDFARLELQVKSLPSQSVPKWYERIRTMTAAIQQADPRPEVKSYLKEVEQIVDWHDLYYAGRYVRLSFDEEFTGWFAMTDEVQSVDADRVRFHTTDPSSGPELTCLARFTPPYIVDAKFTRLSPEYSDASGNTQRPSPVGITIGDARRFIDYGQTGLSFGISGDTSHLVAYNSAAGGWKTLAARLGQERPVWIRIKVWPHHARMYVKGFLAAREDSVDVLLPDEISFGALYGRFPRNFELSEVAIRHIDYGPPPDDLNSPEALAYYEHEVDVLPTDGYTRYMAAQANFAQGNYDAAIAHLEAAKGKFNQWPSLSVLFSQIRLAQGDYAASNAALEQAMEVRSGQWQAMAYLSWNLTTSPVESELDAKRALDLAQRACKLTKDKDWECHRSLANAHASLGNFDAAMASLRTAIRLAPLQAQSSLNQQLADYKNQQPTRGMLPGIPRSKETSADEPPSAAGPADVPLNGSP